MTSQSEQRVYRRRVFYVPGYDPIHPRRYRELYRKESARQAQISGYEIEQRAAPGDASFGWHVSATIDAAKVETRVTVLVWSDIVRASMSGSILSTYGHLFRTAKTYIASGSLWRLMQLRKGPVIAALYPVAFLLLQLLLGCVMTVMSGWIVTEAIVFCGELAGFAMQPAPFWMDAVAFAVGVGVGWGVLTWFKARDGRFYAYYLMHDFAYAAQANGAYPPEFETRIAEFVGLVAQALQSDVDEVLLVGHSSGAHVGVSLLADLIRAGQVPQDGPALGFLSLGQVVPMQSFLPDAQRLRADLQFLSTRDDLTWVDVSAPSDGCAFALCDPVAVSGVASADKKWPLVVSAAFTQSLSAERMATLRWRFFRLHFQYLCAFDHPGDYDYFQITAGPMTLADRYTGRRASPSRIEAAVSKYTSVAVP